jgi:methylated-DNA-protein-cysteine methyltransferase related protein
LGASPPPFAVAVLRAVRDIPRGRVSTYGDVALAAGRPGAARTVGGLLSAATRRDVPYHRVVGADGRVGGAGGPAGMSDAGVAERARRTEGVAVGRDGRISAFAERRWPPPTSS